MRKSKVQNPIPMFCVCSDFGAYVWRLGVSPHVQYFGKRRNEDVLLVTFIQLPLSEDTIFGVPLRLFWVFLFSLSKVVKYNKYFDFVIRFSIYRNEYSKLRFSFIFSLFLYYLIFLIANFNKRLTFYWKQCHIIESKLDLRTICSIMAYLYTVKRFNYYYSIKMHSTYSSLNCHSKIELLSKVGFLISMILFWKSYIYLGCFIIDWKCKYLN